MTVDAEEDLDRPILSLFNFDAFSGCFGEIGGISFAFVDPEEVCLGLG